MTRTPLPDRRRNVTIDAEYRGQSLEITIGFDDAGYPREVFANGAKEGSDMRHVLSDACVVISIALQHGIVPESLARSLGTVPVWGNDEGRHAPASPIGVIVGALIGAAVPAMPKEDLSDATS